MAFLRRLLEALFVIAGAVTLVFFILYWLPGDAAVLVAGDDATEETIQRIRERLGTDRPLSEQYLAYMGNLARGELGTSYVTQEPVLAKLLEQLPATLGLTLAACGVAVVFGLVLGTVSAVNHGRWLDEAIQGLALFFTSMPSFWLGILLILVFSVTLKWLPAIGNGSWQQMVLPVACLGLIGSGSLVRMVRNSLLDVLDQPFVTTLRAKGLRERRVMYVHALRNALIPAVTLLGILAGELLSGTVIVETLFARQGIGRVLVGAIDSKDIPVIQGAILFASVIYVLINVLVDYSYRRIDPRIHG